MCTTAHFRSRACGHHWLQITMACYPGLGFNNCDTFDGGAAREESPLVAVDTLCPACLGPGRYDKNTTRMILDIRNRYRWGYGPDKRSFGADCCVM
ncbi:uncharacterized protein PG998_000717 [Apiospora kogelbergensis]|uniref:Uncharacterized protein n=1 Tax=Apiospora kogelbergensis TaxID=1337665 RepID=A0AAW0QWH6_9PEZI